MTEKFVQKKLWFGFWWCQYWEGEAILKYGWKPALKLGCVNKPKWKKSIYFPWCKTRVSNQWKRADGTWYDKPTGAFSEATGPLWAADDPLAWRKEYPISYTTVHDEVQNETMTVTVERAKYRPRWLRWFPICKYEYGIHFEFSAEMGSERGSWKGGVTASSASMFDGETVDQCVARTIRERRYCR